MSDKQIILRDFAKDNNISIYDLVNCAYWQKKTFLDELFHYLGSNSVLSDVRNYFSNNDYMFKELEENIKSHKYVVITRDNPDRLTATNYFSTGFDTIIGLKTWLQDIELLLPLCLIIDGKLQQSDFKKTVKYDFEIVEDKKDGNYLEFKE